MRSLYCCLAFLLFGAPTLAQTYPPRVRTFGANGPGPLTFEQVVRAGSLASSSGLTFEVVDGLPHQDDFWANMLAGDADHDGLKEIVVRHVPIGGGPNRIQFHEDDGSGQFHGVFQFPLDDGGLLAMGDVDDDGLTDLFFERALGFGNHEFVRWEASSPVGFPDHEVWTGEKEGNVVDFRGMIVDSDSDGLKELVVADDGATTLKIFEAAPGDQMNLIFKSAPVSTLGNPVVADFDLDGRKEIAVAEGQGGRILLFEAQANDTFALVGSTSHALSNAYQLALTVRHSPDTRPMIFLAGQMQSRDYRVQVYEALTNNLLTKVNEVMVPSQCGASIPQIYAADVLGDPTPEIMVDRLCDPVPIYTVGPGGALSLFDAPMIVESLEIVATHKTVNHSGALAIGTFPNGSNPEGKTLVLELE